MRREWIRSVIAAAALLIGTTTGLAQDRDSGPKGAEGARAVPPPCVGRVWWAPTDGAFEDFDFWIGTWQVFDRTSGEMMGFDEVEKVLDGCVIRQHWRHMNDRYAPPGGVRRMEGASHTALGPDGRWHQVWLDNAGSYLAVAGGLDDQGTMVLESEWMRFTNRQGQAVKLKFRWHWQPQADGTIRNWGLRAAGGDEPPAWQTYFDIVYRRNAVGGPRAKALDGDGS